MHIRRIRLEDKKDVLALIDLIGENDYIPYCFDEWADSAQGVFLAAFADVLLGVAYVYFLSGKVAWFQALRVHPRARRKGVGRALTKACLAAAAEVGRKKARLRIDTDNHGSLALTEAAGFSKIAAWLRLEKKPVDTGAPGIRYPAEEELPQLLGLAKRGGLKLWHTDWEAPDLSLAVLREARGRGSLRVLQHEPLAALADITYDEDDREYKVFNPVGEWWAVQPLLLGVEKEAWERSLRLAAVYLQTDSPYTAGLKQMGYRPALVRDWQGAEIADGLTIWEKDL